MTHDHSFPAIDTPERQVLYRGVADRLWPGRKERAVTESDVYWQLAYDKLASDALDAIEAELAESGADDANGISPR